MLAFKFLFSQVPFENKSSQVRPKASKTSESQGSLWGRPEKSLTATTNHRITHDPKLSHAEEGFGNTLINGDRESQIEVS